MSDTSLGTKIGDAVREVATGQATAYTKYATLLDRFAKKEVDFLNFGRDALDIYADAVRDLTQVGGRIANDSVKVGITKVKSLRLVKPAADAASQAVEVAGQAVDTAASVVSEAAPPAGGAKTGRPRKATN